MDEPGIQDLSAVGGGAGLAPPEISPQRGALARWQFRFFPKLERDEDHPRTWEFPAYLGADLPWLRTLRDLYAGPYAFPASIAPEAGVFLFAVVRNLRPRTGVVVGAFIRSRTSWVAGGAGKAAGGGSS